MGNFIDPTKAGMIPMSGEMYTALKKERKDSTRLGAAAGETVHADTSAISDSAYRAAESEKTNDFRQSAIENLSKLDSSSDTFMEEATEQIVGSALEREFGKRMSSQKGFAAMKDTITRQILSNSEQRAGIEKFIQDLMPSVHSLVYGEEE